MNEEDDIISKSLGIKFEPENKEEILLPDKKDDFEVLDSNEFNIVEFKNENELLKDVENSKSIVADVINTSQKAFNDLIFIAKQTENPTAYKVASDMLKNLVDANKSYIDISEKKDKIKNPSKYKEENVTNNTTNNNNLIMTTNDLLRMLKKASEEEKE